MLTRRTPLSSRNNRILQKMNDTRRGKDFYTRHLCLIRDIQLAFLVGKPDIKGCNHNHCVVFSARIVFASIYMPIISFYAFFYFFFFLDNHDFYYFWSAYNTLYLHSVHVSVRGARSYLYETGRKRWPWLNSASNTLSTEGAEITGRATTTAAVVVPVSASCKHWRKCM